LPRNCSENRTEVASEDGERRIAINKPPEYRPFPGKVLFELWRAPIAFLTRLARRYGDVVRFPLGRASVYLINHPDLIQDVLVTHQQNFCKGPRAERAKAFFGEGLVTSEGETHLRQRRLAQPAFHRDRIRAYGSIMATSALRASDQWLPDEVLDIHAEMTSLALTIVAKTLFASDLAEEGTLEIKNALAAIFETFNATLLLPFGGFIEKLPLPSIRRFRAARARLHATIHGIIDQHRDGENRADDLLSMLMTGDGDAGPLSDLQLRDHITVFLLAGGETTANALTWTWYLLAQHPDVEQRLHAEIDRLQGRQLTADDVPQLPYTRMVLAEAIRLYPPIWILGRTVIGAYETAGYHIPPNSIILVCPYLVHRDPRWYGAPDRFDPDRWTPECIDRRPKFSYVPFGAGTRICIGESFAWTEGVLVLASIAQRWKLRLFPGQTVSLSRFSALRPENGLRMVPHRRR
jgi:cytochrome P450